MMLYMLFSLGLKLAPLEGARTVTLAVKSIYNIIFLKEKGPGSNSLP